MSTTDTDTSPETVLYASPAAASGPKWVETPVAYDGILLAGFGGPEGQDDVIPFLRNVTRGRGIPDERLEEVAHHYRHFGGVSPINQHNRELKRPSRRRSPSAVWAFRSTGATATGRRTSKRP